MMCNLRNPFASIDRRNGLGIDNIRLDVTDIVPENLTVAFNSIPCMRISSSWEESTFRNSKAVSNCCNILSQTMAVEIMQPAQTPPHDPTICAPDEKVSAFIFF